MAVHRVEAFTALNVALHFTYRNIFSHDEKTAGINQELSRLYVALGALMVATLNPVKIIIS